MFSGVMFRRNEGQIISWLFFLYIPLLSWASIDRYSFPHRETIFDTPVDAYMYVSTWKVTDILTSLTVEDTSTNSEENKQVGLFPCGPHLEPAVTTCCRPEWGLQICKCLQKDPCTSPTKDRVRETQAMLPRNMPTSYHGTAQQCRAATWIIWFQVHRSH